MVGARTMAIVVAALLLASVTFHARGSHGSSRAVLDAGATPHFSERLTDGRCQRALHGPKSETGGEGGTKRGSRGTYEDTLWIFDADFDDLLGDNAGWTTADQSGTLGRTNYWHHDTIRLTEPYLGDSTWWCGTYDPCWRQPRGYGNNWICILEREFPLSAWSEPGDDVQIEWDQRYAIERQYDYGYVDVSVAGSGSWTTLATYTNVGFVGAGVPVDWSSPTLGHPSIALSAYAGLDVRVRFRFESDCCYSAQDQDDNAQHSVKDGAWQLDNITLTVSGDTFFYDDSESGNVGWIHDDIPATGQAGIAFRRSYEELWVPCEVPRYHEGWMMVAYDSLTGAMVDREHTWLTTPVIDIAGAWKLVGQWEGYVHVRGSSDDYLECRYASSDDPNCWQFVGMGRWWWPGYDWPEWVAVDEDLDLFAGNDWFRMRWILGNDDPAPPTEPHGLGLALDRLRIGIPFGNKTRFEADVWNRFYDTFDLAEALAESARVRIRDDDEIDLAYLVASGDGGNSWGSYELTPILHTEGWWRVPPPSGEIAPSTEIRYYYESTDGLGNVRTFPRDAPGDYFEFSILPIVGSVSEPATLLVDKHGGAIPGEHRDSRNVSEDYYREALDILGLEYDVYDVRVPSGTIYSQGPDTSGMKFYDTQIWFTGDVNAFVLWPVDQLSLIQWLAEAAGGEERNLLLTGNDIGYWLEEAGNDTLDFYSLVLASDYIQNDAGAVTDTMPTVRDAPGDFDFMTHGDGECFLWDDG